MHQVPATGYSLYHLPGKNLTCNIEAMVFFLSYLPGFVGVLTFWYLSYFFYATSPPLIVITHFHPILCYGRSFCMFLPPK